MVGVAWGVLTRKTSWALRPVVWVVVTAMLMAAPYLGLDPNVSRQLVLIAILSLVVSGLNLSFGHAGELSFAQPVIYAVGAYVTAVLALRWVNDIGLALVISAALGFLFGLLTGIPGLRLGGWMLAVSSLFLVLLLPDWIGIFEEWTGGHQGMGGIPIPELFGYELDRTAYVSFVVLVTSVWFGLFRNLVVSRTGTALSVLRQSPVLASSLGISVASMKLKAYALGGIPAAMGGTLFAYLDGYVAPVTFNIAAAVSILAAAILGGSRSVYGIFVGVGLMVVGPMQTTAFGEYAFIFYGVFLVAAGVLLRQGIAGLALSVVQKVRTRGGRATPRVRSVIGDRGELPPMAGARLEIDGISKSFGGVRALNGVTFSVEPGEVVALIGPNGSGKTSLLNVICGYYRPDHGSVRVGDMAVTGLRPHQISRAGVARTFQTPSIPQTTVRDAIAASRSQVSKASMFETMLRLGRYRRARRADEGAVDRLLTLVGLESVAHELAPSLPLGTRRVLELARSLAGEPRVLLLDEVASGLDDEEIQGLSSVIHRIRESGGSVLLVEHNFALVRSLADRVVVLSHGEVVVVDTPHAVAQHPEVLQHYLGQPVPEEDRVVTENVHG